MKTLVDVRTASRFAYGVEIQTPKVALKILYRLEMSAAFSKPLGKARPGKGRANLEEESRRPQKLHCSEAGVIG